jgi:hypothetical protein
MLYFVVVGAYTLAAIGLLVLSRQLTRERETSRKLLDLLIHQSNQRFPYAGPPSAPGFLEPVGMDEIMRAAADAARDARATIEDEEGRANG